jgi:hypothetical protein
VFGSLSLSSKRRTVVPRAASATRNCNVVGIGGNNGDAAGVDDLSLATFAVTRVVSVVAVAIGEDGPRSVQVGSFPSLSTWPTEVPQSSSTSEGRKGDGGNKGDAGDGAGVGDPIWVKLVITAVVFVSMVAGAGVVRDAGVGDNDEDTGGVDIPPFVAFIIVSAVVVSEDAASSA